MKNTECDTETGICHPESLGPEQIESEAPKSRTELIYVGDPMCSWCWGIAPALKKLQRYCGQQEIPFRLVVGGLRAGGGDPWTEQFKQFLSHHWQEISTLTGQPFSYRLLDWDFFDYDTEPACRSVVAARSLRPGSELDFFAAVQHKFYVENEDPKRIEFYRGICSALDMDFDTFVQCFETAQTKVLTQTDFQLSRSLGVTGFPTILLRTRGRLNKIVSGYSTFENMQKKMTELIAHSS